MASDLDREAREAAERRVRDMQARQMAKLIAWQNEQRSEDLGAQKRVLAANARREAALIERHCRAVDRAERDWQDQRERLASRPGPMPAFALGPEGRGPEAGLRNARAPPDAAGGAIGGSRIHAPEPRA